MYLLIEIRHNILIQCYGNLIEKDFNYMLEIDLLRNYLQHKSVVLGVISKGFGRPNEALPTKTRLDYVAKP